MIGYNFIEFKGMAQAVPTVNMEIKSTFSLQVESVHKVRTNSLLANISAIAVCSRRKGITCWRLVNNLSELTRGLLLTELEYLSGFHGKIIEKFAGRQQTR